MRWSSPRTGPQPGGGSAAGGAACLSRAWGWPGMAAWGGVCGGGVGLLISDWEMPEMAGRELCRRIRARSDALYTYIILLTARDRREDRLAGLEAGADDFLIKPLDTGELVARLTIA